MQTTKFNWVYGHGLNLAKSKERWNWAYFGYGQTSETLENSEKVVESLEIPTKV